MQNRRKRTYEETQCVLGGLDDLRGSGKGGMDPNGKGSTVVATDVLWSDPVLEPGLQLNDQRGIGVVFGPDITEVSSPSKDVSSHLECPPIDLELMAASDTIILYSCIFSLSHEGDFTADTCLTIVLSLCVCQA